MTVSPDHTFFPNPNSMPLAANPSVVLMFCRRVPAGRIGSIAGVNSRSIDQHRRKRRFNWRGPQENGRTLLSAKKRSLHPIPTDGRRNVAWPTRPRKAKMRLVGRSLGDVPEPLFEGPFGGESKEPCKKDGNAKLGKIRPAKDCKIGFTFEIRIRLEGSHQHRAEFDAFDTSRLIQLASTKKIGIR